MTNGLSADAESFEHREGGFRLNTLLSIVGALWVIGFIGGIIGPGMVKRNPELVIAMNSVNRHLLLAIGADISAWAFFVIGFLRLIAVDSFAYLLGRGWGDQGLAWIEANSIPQPPGTVPVTSTVVSGGSPVGNGQLGWIGRLFDRAAPVAIFLSPNLIVCSMAGRSRYPLRKMIPLDLAGTVGRLVLVWWLGRQFPDTLKSIVDFMGRYQWRVTLGLFVIAIIVTWRKMAKATAAQSR
jgi:hypothetical protein